MALPIIGASLGGIITGALTAFFATKIPQILAALGLSVAVYSGVDVFVDNLIAEIQSAIGQAGAISVYGASVNGLGILGAAGLFDAANVVLSGYVAVASLKGSKVIWQAVAK